MAPQMTIISRYIVSTNLRLFGLCAGSFMAIYLVVDLLEKVGKFARAGGDPYHILLFFLWKLPEIATQVIPLAVLMATLLTLGSLSRTSELIAMRSAGVGLARVAAPLLGIGLAASLINLALSEWVVPKSFEKMRYIQEVQISHKSPSAFFRQGEIWYREGDTILQARLFDPASTALQGVTLWQLDPTMQPVKRLDAARAEHRGNGWILRSVILRSYSAGSLTRTTQRQEEPIPLKLTLSDLRVVGKQAENMGFMELNRYCAKLSRGGYDATRYLTLLHTKLAAPFSPLVMAFLGIPFALRTGRSSGIAVGIGISLAIGLSYFIINAFLVSFGQAGALPPLVAAWAANLLFIAIGIWLALTMDS